MGKNSGSYYPIFENRYDAGEKLSVLLQRFVTENTCILALARGGIEVAFPVAQRLRLPMDVIVARKIADPSHPELAIGAISGNNTTCINTTLTKHLKLTQRHIDKLIDHEQQELLRRIKFYRDNRSLSFIRDRTVVMIDDGVATGLTAQAALQTTRMMKPKRIIFATPVCAAENLPRLQKYADAVVSILRPHNLKAVSNYYSNFDQIDDNIVLNLLSINHTSFPNYPDYSSYTPS